MIEPTLTIEIERTTLDLPPLVLRAHGIEPGLAISDYAEPAKQARVKYAPDSAWSHGSMPLAASWQQALLGFNVFADGAVSESQARGWKAELDDALIQLAYLVTVTVVDASPEVWTCTAGSVTPIGSRTRADLTDHNPEWSVSIPCYPIPQVS